MGKKSHRRKTVDAEVCPVCTNPFGAKHPIGGVPDNTLGCANGHLVCVDCMSHLLVAKEDKCNASCSMTAYICPMCRAHACIGNVHLLVLAKRSWTEAWKCFPCEHVMAKWDNREL